MAHNNFYASQWDYDSYHSFLIERFTLRSLFFNATCFLMIGSFICMLGINFPMLLVGRSIQALGAGILMPLTDTPFHYVST